MKSYKVELSLEANRDLDAIFDYILLHNSQAAYEMLNKIFSSLEQLSHFPELGAEVRRLELSTYQFRMLVIKPYLAFYRIFDNKVYVYRVLHASQDYISIFTSN